MLSEAASANFSSLWFDPTGALSHNTIFHFHKIPFGFLHTNISGVTASMLALSVADCGLEPQSGQTRDLKNWHLLLH
jgi:hypothetical protein